MTRKLRPLAALATVALIGAGGSYSYAATGKTASKRSSAAPGKLPPKGSSRSKRSAAPGKLPPKGLSRSKRSVAPGKLPPKGSSR